MQLTKAQRNELFELLGSAGANPTRFELTSVKGDYRLKHLPSASVCEFRDDSSGGVLVRWLVDNEPARITIVSSWPRVMGLIREWVVDEILAPDLWEEGRREREFLSASGYETVGNTLFTEAEQAEITAQLREITGYVKRTISLSSEQMALVEARFDEAETAARHIGRKDWLLLFMGIIFTLIITGALPPNAVQHIFEMALHGLSHLFGGGDGKPLKPPSIT